MKIEKGIPAPPAPAQRSYPFAAMEIGDSFFVECASPCRSVRVQASKQSKRLGRTFTVRATEGGVRVWRTA